MKIPVRPTAACRPAGFTLLELLVVIVIIGVLATLVSLSVSGRAVDDRMQAESRRLEQLLQLATDESQAKGLELGFRVTTEGVEFLAPDGRSGQWSVIEEGLFRPRTIASPFGLELRIDGRLQRPAVPVNSESPAPTALELDEERRVEPQVLILSSGEVTAFTLDVLLPDNPAVYRVEGTALGQFSTARLQRPEDRP